MGAAKVSFGVAFSGILLDRDDARRFMELVKMADGFGVEAIGTDDSAFIGGDAYMRTALMALASERAQIGPRPTNPLTREPQVTTACLAEIDSLTNGRAFMNIASGDSAVFNIGYGSASRARIEDYVTCIRDLLATGQASYQGRPQRVRWAVNLVRRRIPISINAEGPKILHLAGRIGDGVSIGSGLTADVVKDSIARVHAGAHEAGRKSGDVDIWFNAATSLHMDRAKAMEHAEVSVASILNHSMRSGLEGKLVPDELMPRVQEYVGGYVLHDHTLAGGRNVTRMEQLGLTEYALKRWGLAGDPTDWIKRIEEIAEAGVAKLWVRVGTDELDSQLYGMRIFGEQIMPFFA